MNNLISDSIDSEISFALTEHIFAEARFQTFQQNLLVT